MAALNDALTPEPPAPLLSRRTTLAWNGRSASAAWVLRGENAFPAILAVTTVASLGAASGGYFETAWGWSSLALLWVAAVALLLRTNARLGLLEVGFVASIAGFGAWTLVSAAWGASLTQAVREGQRTLVYAAGVFAALLLIRSRSYRSVLGGVWAGCAAVSTYALSTRLFDPQPDTTELEGYRLSAALGYWNALGIFAAIGLVLAVGLAARARRPLISGLAAASTVPLLATTYFTFGRGPWLALAVGLGAAIALDLRRLQLALMTLVLAAPGALALWLAFHSEALTHEGSSVSAAEREGQRLAVLLALLAAAAAFGALFVRWLGQRFSAGRLLRLTFGGALVVALGIALLATFARYGSPPALVEKGYDSLNAAPPQTNGDLSKRLFDVSSRGRIDHWRVAWSTFEDRPLLGSGAGTFEQHWLQDRSRAGVARDAHNIYLETLAELGVVGLALLVIALAAPLIAAARGRRHALVPAAFGAYVAYLVHAGLDWDWEMPAVTLAALLCGAAILAATRRQAKTFVLGTRARVGLVAVTTVLGAAAFVGLMGNQAVASSKNAEKSGELAQAESKARAAVRWAPWSARAWERLAEVRFAQDDLKGARAALIEALEKDPGDWALWYRLGVASEGAERLRAYREAARLNPLSKNVAVLRTLRVLPPLTKEKKR
jgi:O-Antigen ligase/Tetratricopeptide repeat